jgi:hypothetical protein
VLLCTHHEHLFSPLHIFSVLLETPNYPLFHLFFDGINKVELVNLVLGVNVQSQRAYHEDCDRPAALTQTEISVLDVRDIA